MWKPQMNNNLKETWAYFDEMFSDVTNREKMILSRFYIFAFYKLRQIYLMRVLTVMIF